MSSTLLPKFEGDATGRKCAHITNAADGSSIVVYQQGAHLTSWKTKNGAEQLYMSPKSVFADGKALRGGVPLIFPQFASRGPSKVSHGFLRTWGGFAIAACVQTGKDCAVTFTTEVKPGDDANFPDMHCHVEYTVTFCELTLKLAMKVTNLQTSADLKYNYAFHSYFAVPDIQHVAVKGVEKAPYLDTMQGGKPMDPQEVSRFDGEVDRIFPNIGEFTLHVKAPGDGGKKLGIFGKCARDVVVWNPWIEKTKQLTDMPEDGYRHFVCIEHGTILEPIVLKPGESFCGEQHVNISTL